MEFSNSYKDLEVWKTCRELRKKVFPITSRFPAEEKYRLVDQLRRAAVSATANVAEGYGRYHYQENIQFCRQARGSLYEILDHLTTCLDQSYISEGLFDELKREILVGIKLTNGYLRMLQKSKVEYQK